MIIKIFITIALTLFLTALGYAFLKHTPYEPIPYNIALDENLSKKIGANPTYGVLFKRSNSSLLYIATKHANKISSSTFQWIKSAFEKFSPDIVIVEGIETSEGQSPKSIVTYIKNNCLKNWHCGEPLYAAHLASINHIPFIGGEVGAQAISQLLENKQYSPEDITFFYFTRQIPEYYREKSLSSEEQLKEKFKTFTNQFTYNDYIEWLHEKLKTTINFKMLIDSNLTAPISSGNYLQKLSSEINLIRDQHILNLIREEHKLHEKILVIYGASHFSTQEMALIQLLDKPIYFSTIKVYKLSK